MIVMVNFERQIREAYNAGAFDAAMYLKSDGPQPDANRYIEQQQKLDARPIPKF